MNLHAKTYEILAPAGSSASLQAAIDAGADAVYFGLAQLNMRARSRRSFDLEDLPRIMARCRSAGVRGYLTLNTLLYDNDLELCDRLLQAAKAERVDAIIAADMACILRARELGLECHLSTQLSVSNYQAFKFYAQFCDRIVLARELDLTMIRKIRAQILADDLRGPSGRPVEIEAFAHGALCIAISGRCNMSLFTNNTSANRGACLQACRRSYTVTDTASGEAMTLDNNYVFSPNDISTLEFLDEVLAAGVQTLKIEGRGRSPEYVKLVTAAYREAANAVSAGAFEPALVERLLKNLRKVYNRGHASGYYLGRPQGWAAAYGSKASHQKILAGEVSHYYPKIQVAEIRAARPIRTGLDYLIIGNTSGVIEGQIADIRLDEGPVTEARRGDCFSLKVPQRVRPGDKFFLFEPISTGDRTTGDPSLRAVGEGRVV
ncbi:MAG: peptidase U32 family protein [Opitutales bacterium]